MEALVSTRTIAALHPAAGGRWNAEQGPRLRGCDRGTGRERVATGPMRIFAVRSPEGPLFLATTRHPSAKADGTCSALRGRKVGVKALVRVLFLPPPSQPSPVEGEGVLSIADRYLNYNSTFSLCSSSMPVRAA